MADLSQPNFDETDANNNQASPNGAPEGMAPSGVNDAIRANMGALKRFWNRINGTALSAGSGSAYSISYSATPSAQVAGEMYSFKVHTVNATGATLKIGTLTAKKLYKNTSSGPATVSVSDVPANSRLLVQYDSTLDGYLIIAGIPPALPLTASYLVVSADAALTGAYALTGGAGITLNTATASANVAIDYNKTGSWKAQQAFTCLSLSDSTTIDWNLNLGQVAAVTLGGSARIIKFTNAVNGGAYILRVYQDGSGNRSVSINGAQYPGATKPSYSTTAGAMDILTFTSDGTSLFGTISKNFG